MKTHPLTPSRRCATISSCPHRPSILPIRPTKTKNPRQPSSADVAVRAGVSRSTVSVVLNGHREPIIAEATRERVLQAARDLNYRPNQLARALITGSSHLIGLWMWSLPSPYDVSIIQTALGLLRADGFQALLFEMTPGREAEMLLDPAAGPSKGSSPRSSPTLSSDSWRNTHPPRRS